MFFKIKVPITKHLCMGESYTGKCCPYGQVGQHPGCMSMLRKKLFLSKSLL